MSTLSLNPVQIDQTTPGTTNGVVVNSGTVTTTGTVAATGTITVVQGTGTNLHTVVDSGTITIVPSGTMTIAGAVTQGTSPWVIGGAAASGASVSGNPVLNGGRAQNAEATAVSNGQAVDMAFDLVGRQIISPYANKENWLSGSITQTGTAAGTLVASPGASVKIYATSLIVTNTGTTNSAVQLNDAASTVLPAPGVGGSIVQLPVPLAWAANTAATATPLVASSTIYVTLAGFKGS